MVFVVSKVEEEQVPGEVYIWMVPGPGEEVRTSTLRLEGFLGIALSLVCITC